MSPTNPFCARAAENSNRQSPKVRAPRKAGNFEAVSGGRDKLDCFKQSSFKSHRSLSCARTILPDRCRKYIFCEKFHAPPSCEDVTCPRFYSLLSTLLPSFLSVNNSGNCFS